MTIFRVSGYGGCGFWLVSRPRGKRKTRLDSFGMTVYSTHLTHSPYLYYGISKEYPVLVKITSKRQVTFPARVLDALGVGPGDQLELEEGPDGFTLRARRVNPTRLAPLRGKLKRTDTPFDIESFRDEPRDPTLRD